MLIKIWIKINELTIPNETGLKKLIIYIKKKYNGGIKTEGSTFSPISANFGIALNSSKAT